MSAWTYQSPGLPGLGEMVKAFPAWLRHNIVAAAVSAAVAGGLGYVANIWVMAKRYDGYNVPPGSIAPGPDNYATGVVFWSLASLVLCTVVGYWRAAGTERFVADVKGMPAALAGVFRADGATARVHVLWGAAATLLVSALVAPPIGGVAGLGLVAAAPTALGTVLVVFLTQTAAKVVGKVSPARQVAMPPRSAMTVGLLGGAAGLLLGYLVDDNEVSLLLAGVAAVAAYALSRGHVPPAATALLAVIAGVALHRLLQVEPAWADDGGFVECGNSWEQWLDNCPGAAEVIRRALGGAIPAGFFGPGGIYFGEAIAKLTGDPGGRTGNLTGKPLGPPQAPLGPPQGPTQEAPAYAPSTGNEPSHQLAPEPSVASQVVETLGSVATKTSEAAGAMVSAGGEAAQQAYTFAKGMGEGVIGKVQQAYQGAVGAGQSAGEGIASGVQAMGQAAQAAGQSATEGVTSMAQGMGQGAKTMAEGAATLTGQVTAAAAGLPAPVPAGSGTAVVGVGAAAAAAGGPDVLPVEPPGASTTGQAAGEGSAGEPAGAGAQPAAGGAAPAPAATPAGSGAPPATEPSTWIQAKAQGAASAAAAAQSTTPSAAEVLAKMGQAATAVTMYGAAAATGLPLPVPGIGGATTATGATGAGGWSNVVPEALNEPAPHAPVRDPVGGLTTDPDGLRGWALDSGTFRRERGE